MVNEISLQISEGDLRYPAYSAFPAARLQEEPWKPQLPTHDRAAGDWEKRMAGLRSSHALSSHAYILYFLRVIFPAHMFRPGAHSAVYPLNLTLFLSLRIFPLWKAADSLSSTISLSGNTALP